MIRNATVSAGWTAIIQGGPKKVSLRSLHITSSNTGRFSKFFHCHILQEICNKLIIKYSTSSQTCRYTTLWNMKAFLKLFIKLFEFTGKSSTNNAKQYRKLIQEDGERSYNQYILFKIAAAACHESGFWRVHLSARLRRSAQNTLFMT